MGFQFTKNMVVHLDRNHDYETNGVQFTLKEILGTSVSCSDALAAIRADSIAHQTFSPFPLEE